VTTTRPREWRRENQDDIRTGDARGDVDHAGLFLVMHVSSQGSGLADQRRTHVDAMNQRHVLWPRLLLAVLLAVAAESQSFQALANESDEQEEHSAVAWSWLAWLAAALCRAWVVECWLANELMRRSGKLPGEGDTNTNKVGNGCRSHFGVIVALFPLCHVDGQRQVPLTVLDLNLLHPRHMEAKRIQACFTPPSWRCTHH
jgi:hypothetical protein